MFDMRRREFITLLGAAAAWPLAARAQQASGMRHIGMLLPAAADDLRFQVLVGAFLQGLAPLGWRIGRNVRIETRWATPAAAEIRRHAAELAALAPDVILAHGAGSVAALLQATRTIPIVFANVPDPVGIGLVASMARPGGNLTGFTNFEPLLAGKWLELLREIVPRLTRVGVMYSPDNPGWPGRLQVIQAVAQPLGIDVTPVGVRDAPAMEQAVDGLFREPNGGWIVLPSILMAAHRETITALMARHRVPAVYAFRYYVTGGGLISYGISEDEQFRNAAFYVDRILRAKSRPICRCRRQPSSSWRSISRPPRPSASRFRRRCSPAPTR
jgi:ABC-type uncharacterized transport system substrate-binding protein